MKITIKIAINLCVLCFLTLPHCSPKGVAVNSTPGAVYHSLKMKVKIRNEETGQKQSIKVLVKYDNLKTRMLFLGPPMNKVYAKLHLRGESALLINSRKNIYWRGNFIVLLRRMWDMDFDFHQFKQLILIGTIPTEKGNISDIAIRVEKDAEGRHPSLIEVNGNLLSLEMKISSHKSRTGTLTLTHNLAGLDRVQLDRVLEQE